MSTATDRPLVYEHVSRRYGAMAALDDVSLTIERGAFVALVGASGSGKSSLLRLANLLDRPDSGRVLVDGRDVATADPIRLRRSIGYVFQNVGLFPHMDVAENIGISARLDGGAPIDIAAALDQVGLSSEMAARLPAQLSGGQQQRIGIARALAGRGRLLLMDEPFGALDPVTRQQLGQMVKRLHEQLELTTILVTHDMAEALLLADRVLVMAHGRIVADAAPRDLLAGAAGPEAEALLAVPRAQSIALAELGA